MFLVGCEGQPGPQGPAGDPGPQGPPGIAGTNCTVAPTPGGAEITCSNGAVVVLNGSDGQNGNNGNDGQNGNRWFNTTVHGPVHDSYGYDNDYYLDSTTGDVYFKASGTWASPVFNIRGPQGIQGPVGPQGPTGAAGTCSSSNFFTVSSNVNAASITVNCGTGKKAISGGGNCGGGKNLQKSCSSNSGATCNNSLPDQYWTITCSGANAANTAYAICL